PMDDPHNVYTVAILPDLHCFPTRRSFDLPTEENQMGLYQPSVAGNPLTPESHEADLNLYHASNGGTASGVPASQLAIQNHSQMRSEEHTSELQSRENLVCRLLLEKKIPLS